MKDNIDITYDFRNDTPKGKDPDKYSSTLRKYHKALWSKPLPDGNNFNLVDTHKDKYLLYQSEQGEFILTSDSCIPTFTRWKRMQHIVGNLSDEENEEFRAIGYTIGGMMIWPGKPVNGLHTINVERGFNSKISDRLDLTLECIRLFYLGIHSPMHEVLRANANYFSLFVDFKGFVDHFLLQDLVDADYKKILFLTEEEPFKSSPIPNNLSHYLKYKKATINFINLRNSRIANMHIKL